MDNGGTSGLGLSPEGERIVALVLAVYKNKDIAGHLSLSDRTVRRHMARVLGEHCLCNKLELALFVTARRRFAGA